MTADASPLPAPPAPPAPVRAAVLMFSAFAFAYFFSALLRAVTATLAPAFSAELGLSAGDLGLLAGAYFLGFSLMQLPLGRVLDRFGPRRVLLLLLALAVLACAAFALARNFASLLAARALIGVGVSACLMAPLTAYRHHFGAPAQLRANSWMLMTGSLGMLASTLPVQWLLPVVGWRGLFWGVAGLLALATVLLAWAVPSDRSTSSQAASHVLWLPRNLSPPVLRALGAVGLLAYGGLVAVQSLWAGPWLTDVAGHDAASAASGLFAINLSMLFAFFGWGVVMPHLTRRGWQVDRLIASGVPLSLLLLFGAVVLGPRAGAAGGQRGVWPAHLSRSASLRWRRPSRPAAGRALSAFNLVIFLGVFCVQWGIGLTIDVLQGMGWSRGVAFQTRSGCSRWALPCRMHGSCGAGAVEPHRRDNH